MDRGLAQTESSPLRTARRCGVVLTRTANDGALLEPVSHHLAPGAARRRTAATSPKSRKPSPRQVCLAGRSRNRVAWAVVRLPCVRRQTTEGVPTSERRQHDRGAARAANGHAIDDPEGLDENDTRRWHAQDGDKAHHDTRRRENRDAGRRAQDGGQARNGGQEDHNPEDDRAQDGRPRHRDSRHRDSRRRDARSVGARRLEPYRNAQDDPQGDRHAQDDRPPDGIARHRDSWHRDSRDRDSCDGDSRDRHTQNCDEDRYYSSYGGETGSQAHVNAPGERRGKNQGQHHAPATLR